MVVQRAGQLAKAGAGVAQLKQQLLQRLLKGSGPERMPGQDSGSRPQAGPHLSQFGGSRGRFSAQLVQAGAVQQGKGMTDVHGLTVLADGFERAATNGSVEGLEDCGRRRGHGGLALSCRTGVVE